MGVKILTDTTDAPITMMGHMAGICYGTDISNTETNYKRGLNCLKANHGRVMEYPQIYLEITDYSAKVIREFTRHIGGLSTFLQASTRYIDYTDFQYVIPQTIKENNEAVLLYENVMTIIADTMKILEQDYDIPKEDSSMIAPLGMSTHIIWRGNLRTLYDMSRVRLCNRAFWEFRQLFKEIIQKLSNYSKEWKILIEEEKIFKPRCDDYGYCIEKYSCGRHKKKGEN